MRSATWLTVRGQHARVHTFRKYDVDVDTPKIATASSKSGLLGEPLGRRQVRRGVEVSAVQQAAHDFVLFEHRRDELPDQGAGLVAV